MITLPHLRLRRIGFTLIELLTVLGVIAILVALLLTALASARRHANQVRCLAALHEVGHASKLYANDFKGDWPVAVHEKGPYTPALPLLPEERRWYDLIAPYAGGARNAEAGDVAGLRRRAAAAWGCPEWVSSAAHDPAGPAANLQVGYAMQFSPLSGFGEPEKPAAKHFAFISASGQAGCYIPATTWNRRGDQRGLIGCSNSFFAGTPKTFSRSTSQWQPFPRTDLNELPVQFDSTRHLKGGTGKAASAKLKGLNMLFADGHANSVSIVEAWNAIRCPGEDRAAP